MLLFGNSLIIDNMPKTSSSPGDCHGSFSYRERSKYHRLWSAVGGGEFHRRSPLATSVRDTRVWKAVMDHLDIQCDLLHRLRRQTDKRFVTMTTDDILAGMTEVLDTASYSLEEGRDRPTPSSPNLVRCKMAEGIPAEFLFSLEEDGEMTNDNSPESSCDSSTITASSTLTSSGTLVAPGDLEEWGPEGCDWDTLSPPMDCERVHDEEPPRRDAFEIEEREEDQGSQGGTWRDAICFRQYHRLTRPKMSWRRAHESVRRRKMLTSRGRHGQSSRAWSPRLNVSWTSIEEEIKKGGLLSSPVKLTTLISSPVRVPLSVVKINEERVTKEAAKSPKLPKSHVKKTEDVKQGQDVLPQNNRKDESEPQDQQGKKAVMGQKRPQESTLANDSPGLPTALRVGRKRNTNHGNNTAKQTRKSERTGGASVRKRLSDVDAKLVSVMEQYVTAQPFVPKDMPLPKTTEPVRGRGTNTMTTKNGAKESSKWNQNVVPNKTDVTFKNKRKGDESDADKKKRLQNALQQPSTETARVQTFQREQLPIPVIEQGVVHHRHQSPPTIQQTTEGVSRPDAEPTGDRDKSERPNDLPAKEAPGRHLVAPQRIEQQQHQQHQEASGLPLGPEQQIPERGSVGPPGIPVPAPWNQNPGVALAFRHRHPPPPQISAQIPYINLPLPMWPATNRPYQNPQLSQQHHSLQGMPNNIQQPFPNSRHPQEQMLPMMHPLQPFTTSHQQEQMQLMQMQQTFVKGRLQDQMPTMQPQQPFVNGYPKEQVPMMQQATQGQSRPMVMLEDPCILFAQRNNFQQNGQNNNNLRSGYQPRQQESTNQPHVNQQNQLGHQGQLYQRNQRQPFPQGQYQQNNNSNHHSFTGNNSNNCNSSSNNVSTNVDNNFYGRETNQK